MSLSAAIALLSTCAVRSLQGRYDSPNWMGYNMIQWDGRDGKSARMASLLEGKENIWKHARSEELLPLSSIIFHSDSHQLNSRAANLVQQRHGGGKTSDALFEAKIRQSDLPLATRWTGMMRFRLSIIFKTCNTGFNHIYILYIYIYIYICRSIESIKPMIHWLDMGWFNGKITGDSKKKYAFLLSLRYAFLIFMILMDFYAQKSGVMRFKNDTPRTSPGYFQDPPRYCVAHGAWNLDFFGWNTTQKDPKLWMLSNWCGLW